MMMIIQRQQDKQRHVGLFLIVQVLLAVVVTVRGTSEVLTVHGSGTTNPSNCLWHIMDQIMDQVKIPVRLTYRSVGSGTGIVEFVDGLNDFGCGDIPLPRSQYDALAKDGVKMIHLPFVLGAVTFFHNVPLMSDNGGLNPKLKLSSCVLAKIFKREITDWDDPEIAADNPNIIFPPGLQIIANHFSPGSSSTSVITSYLHSSCPQEWPIDMVGPTIDWAAGTAECDGSSKMVDCINSGIGTIGYVDAGHGLENGLSEVEVQNAAGNFITSSRAKVLGGLQSAEYGAIPPSLDADFSNITLIDRPGSSTFPIVAMTYVYVRKDLAFMKDPNEASLLVAFLKALYEDNYINQCEDFYGFTKVSMSTRLMALDAINSLNVMGTSNRWSFESSVQVGAGMGDYVISQRRTSRGILALQQVTDELALVEEEIETLKLLLANRTAEMNNMKVLVEENSAIRDMDITGMSDGDYSKLNAAIGLALVSIILCLILMIVLIMQMKRIQIAEAKNFPEAYQMTTDPAP